MSIYVAIFLGIVQGLGEFIPISSSGHLILAHHFLDTGDGRFSFDVALNVGSFLALLIFFYKDIFNLFYGARNRSDERRLMILLAIGTLPAVFVGFLLESAAKSAFRSAILVSFNLIVVGCIMLLAEQVAAKKPAKIPFKGITPRQAWIMGCAQAAAIIPGVSRSGGTIAAGLFVGLDRVAATRFSFLLSIPIVFGAILKTLTEPGAFESIKSDTGIVAAGIIAALVSGLIAIKFLLGFLARHSLALFAYYRIVVGTVVLLGMAAGLF